MEHKSQRSRRVRGMKVRWSGLATGTTMRECGLEEHVKQALDRETDNQGQAEMCTAARASATSQPTSHGPQRNCRRMPRTTPQ
eukprot:3586381-Pleurochrysis_carterae.AAC.1